MALVYNFWVEAGRPFRARRPVSFMAKETEVMDNETSAPISDGAEKYDASKIDKLEGLEAVRKRAGMYIGDPDERGLHHCVFDVLDNSIDEHLAGYCKHTEMALHVHGSCSIPHDERPIQLDIHHSHTM